MHGKGLRTLALLTALTLTAAYALVFFWTPNEADQGFVQKIFYLHVPMAIVALCGFVAGGIAGAHVPAHARRRSGTCAPTSRSTSRRSSPCGVLITGAIWAKASWGHWWLWDEPMLVSFLIVFLLYATYQVLRFSIEDRERQARYASVFAVVAGAFVPINFAVVRMAQSYVHPRTLGTTTGGMPGEMMLTFLIALVGDGAAVRDPLEVRDGVQERRCPGARAAPAPPRRRRCRCRGAARPPCSDAGASPRRGRQVRRRRLPRVPRPAAHLRRDHGRAAEQAGARPHGAQRASSTRRRGQRSRDPEHVA